MVERHFHGAVGHMDRHFHCAVGHMDRHSHGAVGHTDRHFHSAVGHMDRHFQWGANMKILTQVYTAAVRPHMEYASSAWSSAAKTNLDQLTKTQNAGLRTITGGMKTIPISELERTAGLLSLGERRQCYDTVVKV